jgi:hypothetical protein
VGQFCPTKFSGTENFSVPCKTGTKNIFSFDQKAGTSKENNIVFYCYNRKKKHFDNFQKNY